MDSSEFLHLARELAVDESEVRLRSAVSRAYYGAFHAARDLLESCGVLVPRHDVHDKLQWCLRNSGDEELAKVGESLDGLRRHRNTADYNLSDKKCGNRMFVGTIVIAAVNTADLLRGWRLDPAGTESREPIRAYATNILQWQASSA